MRRGVGSERDDREEVELHVHRLTAKAVLVSSDGDADESVWLPISQVDTSSGGPILLGVQTLMVPQWLLEREGLC